jgi:hypothetical protein
VREPRKPWLQSGREPGPHPAARLHLPQRAGQTGERQIKDSFTQKQSSTICRMQSSTPSPNMERI